MTQHSDSEPRKDPDQPSSGRPWDIDLSGLEELASAELKGPAEPAEPAESDPAPASTEPADEPDSLPPPVTAPFDDVRAVLRRLRVSVERIDVRMSSIEDEVRRVGARLEELIARLPTIRSDAAGAASQEAIRALRKDLVALQDRIVGELAALRQRIPTRFRPTPAPAASPATPPAAPAPTRRPPEPAAPDPAPRDEQDLQRLREKVWGSEPPKT